MKIFKLQNVFFILIALLFVRTGYAKGSNSIIILKGNWEYRSGNSLIDNNGKPFFVRKDYQDTLWKPVESPQDIDNYSRADVWFRTLLPNWNGMNPAIFIRIAKEMVEVYLNGNRIYSYGNFNDLKKVKFGGLEWHIIKLSEDFAGKTLIIHVRADHPYPGIMGDVLLGSVSQIISMIIKDNLFGAILGFVFILSGLIFIVILYLVNELGAYKGFIIMQISMGVWTLTNSAMLQFIITAPRALSYFNDISMYSTAIGLFLLVEVVIARRYKIIFRRIWQFFTLYGFAMVLIDFLIHPFHRFIASPFYLLVICGIIILMFLSIKSYRIVKVSEKRFLVALNSYLIFVIIEMLRYYFGIFFGGGPTSETVIDFGGLILFVFLIWLTVQKYVDMNKQIIISQEIERRRIARDLHDEIGPRLTEIKIISERVKHNSIPGKFLEEKMEELSSASDSVVSSFREIVWALNPTNNTLEELATYLGQCTSDFLSKTDIRCRLNMASELPDVRISYEVRRDVIMAVKEALNNAVKHAEASILTLTLSYENRNLKIKITDDGVGFNLNDVRKFGNGLRNIRQRIEGDYGKVDITRGTSSGTTVAISVPL